MGKKKFIDKKHCATYRLVFKESSAAAGGAIGDGTDRVFVRVGGGDSHVTGFDSNTEEEDAGEQVDQHRGRGLVSDDAHREMLELGFPDDGYNYLQHLRDIGPSGGIGDFVPSTRVRLDSLHPDVKAFDASNVRVPSSVEDRDSNALSVNGVAQRIRGPVSKVIDPDVAALLDKDDDVSPVSGDELEDDFVIIANDCAEGFLAEESSSDGEYRGLRVTGKHMGAAGESEEEEEEDDDGDEGCERPARFLDEQFELLALREYDDEDIGELDDNDISAHGPAHISKFNTVISDFLINNTFTQDKYQTPSEIKTCMVDSFGCSELNVEKVKEDCLLLIPSLDKGSILASAAFYKSSSSSEKELVVGSDSDSDGARWDCDSIVTTYSNLDNHPGKICSLPNVPRKNTKSIEDNQSVIRLRGKQQLPVDYLPKRGHSQGDMKNKCSSEGKIVNAVRKRAEETKEEKKARKAAIKEGKRTARALKKDMKLTYKDEAHRAQRTAASTGPATLRL